MLVVFGVLFSSVKMSTATNLKPTQSNETDQRYGLFVAVLATGIVPPVLDILKQYWIYYCPLSIDVLNTIIGDVLIEVLLF